jgi:hypothetical protein
MGAPSGNNAKDWHSLLPLAAGQNKFCQSDDSIESFGTKENSRD